MSGMILFGGGAHQKAGVSVHIHAPTCALRNMCTVEFDCAAAIQ
jgi:hypothetical protein